MTLLVLMLVVCLRGKVLVRRGGCRGSLCEKLLEASPISNRASSSQLQEGPAAGQGRVKKEGKEVLQALEQRFPCSLWKRSW